MILEGQNSETEFIHRNGNKSYAFTKPSSYRYSVPENNYSNIYRRPENNWHYGAQNAPPTFGSYFLGMPPCQNVHAKCFAGIPLIQTGVRYKSRMVPRKGKNKTLEPKVTFNIETEPCKEESSVNTNNNANYSQTNDAGLKPGNILPRIIKPRKRRKKEKKLTPIDPGSGEQQFSDAKISQIVSQCPEVPAVLASETGKENSPENWLDFILDDTPLNLEYLSVNDRPSSKYNDRVWSSGYFESSEKPQSWDPEKQWNEYNAKLNWNFKMDQDSCCGPNVTSTGSYGRNGSLQVSSQIVTSPNGHRDIEIKFFSSNSLCSVT